MKSVVTVTYPPHACVVYLRTGARDISSRTDMWENRGEPCVTEFKLLSSINRLWNWSRTKRVPSRVGRESSCHQTMHVSNITTIQYVHRCGARG